MKPTLERRAGDHQHAGHTTSLNGVCDIRLAESCPCVEACSTCSCGAAARIVRCARRCVAPRTADSQRRYRPTTPPAPLTTASSPVGQLGTWRALPSLPQQVTIEWLVERYCSKPRANTWPMHPAAVVVGPFSAEWGVPTVLPPPGLVPIIQRCILSSSELQLAFSSVLPGRGIACPTISLQTGTASASFPQLRHQSAFAHSLTPLHRSRLLQPSPARGKSLLRALKKRRRRRRPRARAAILPCAVVRC